MVQDDAGAEEVVVDADEVRQLRVQDHTDPLFPQSQSLLLHDMEMFLLQTDVKLHFTSVVNQNQVKYQQRLAVSDTVSMKNKSHLQNILCLVPLVGPLFRQLQHLRTNEQIT